MTIVNKINLNTEADKWGDLVQLTSWSTWEEIGETMIVGLNKETMDGAIMK